MGRSPIPWIAWPHKLCPANWTSSTAGLCDVISQDSWSWGSFVHIPPKCVCYHVVILCTHKWSAFSVRTSDTRQLHERVFYIRFPDNRKSMFMNVLKINLLSFPQKYSDKGEVMKKKTWPSAILSTTIPRLSPFSAMRRRLLKPRNEARNLKSKVKS